jgi:hypothetical protein
LRDSEELVALLSNLRGVDPISGKIEDKFVEGRVRHRADIDVDQATGIVLRDRPRFAAFPRSPQAQHLEGARACLESALFTMRELCLEGLFPAVKADHFSPPLPDAFTAVD